MTMSSSASISGKHFLVNHPVLRTRDEKGIMVFACEDRLLEGADRKL